jgi:Uri superfamily endonuclease
MIKGVYQLHLRLDKPKRIRVGKLGVFTFPAGRYIYTGSAMNGLIGRLRRHLKKRKKLHWHIDYLLRHAKIETIFVLETGERVECQLNSLTLSLPNAKGGRQRLRLFGLPLSFPPCLLRRRARLNFPNEGGEGRCLRQPLRSQRQQRRAVAVPRRRRASDDEKGAGKKLPAPITF